MRMEVEREVSAAASAVEASMASEAVQKAEERLREAEEERQHWISKREEALARQDKLLKLLKLQDLKSSTIAQKDPQKVTEEGELAKKEEDKAAKAAAAVLTRKKELKELQARAEAAREKQQAAVTVLARNLKQLQAKRKREEKEVNEQPRKKANVGNKGAVEIEVAAPKMHPFAAAPDLDVGTVELANAACFRIATRHLAQTGTMISKEKLQEAFKIYTGKVLDEVVDWSVLGPSLACLLGESRQSIPFSTSRTRRRSVCWQPGRQYLKTPTFISSDSDRIQSLIEAEKAVVIGVYDTLSDNRNPAFIRRHRQRQFVAALLDDGGAESTLSAIFSAFVGANSVESTPGNNLTIPYRSHKQVAGVLDKVETWLSEQAEISEPHSSLFPKLNGSRGLREQVFSSKYTKPFSVTNDSVVRQLRRITLKLTGSKKIDPMKVLCHYELNGVCNDKNCSNYHQKDFEPVGSEVNNSTNCDDNEDDDDTGSVRVLKIDEVDQLLASFVEFRGRIMPKWPVITSSRTPTKPEEETNSRVTVAADTPSSHGSGDRVPVAQGVEEKDDRSEEDKVDFIMLDSQEELPQTGDARYFDDIDSRKTYGDILQAKVEEDPSDTDAWLLFAIYQLQLEIGLSDEAVNLSEDDRLKQQLLFLCKELNIQQRSGTSSPRLLVVEEANLKRCLHTLSRALEKVEANAYCEALWLLYLHLCKQVTNKETEIDMVEQAVQFLPKSHALWLRYVSTYEFESVGMAEGIYWRLLEHLAQVNPAEEVSSPQPTKERSILLTAISFHLCIKLWRAEARSRVLELMSALLQFGDTSTEFEWCNLVRGQLRSDELIAFCLAFAHVLLFNEIPGLIEHWVAVSSCESIPVKGMIYSADFLRRDRRHIDDTAIEKALTSYGLAFQTFERQCAGVQNVGNVILTNWMLLIGFVDDRSTKDESLNLFFREKFDTIQQYPGASLTAAKIMKLKSTGEQNQDEQLMLAMMNRSSDTQFPKALHHYLFACRQSPALVTALDKTFPDVMERLASLLDVDIEKVEKSIQDIMHDTSNISKSRALKALLDALLSAWMDQLASLHRGPSQAKSLANIYVSLDICHLMGILLEPSVAIDGIQMILSSSNFGALSLDARQLAWMQRFVFQVDLLQQEVSDSLSWRDHQTRLTQLFRKYISEMSVEAEMMRQVSKEIKNDGGKYDVADAVCACLYPERNNLITYNVNLELFRLCSAAVSVSEKAAFYASYTDALALSSEFSLAFSDTAVHEWELLAARASLRKCLSGAKTQHPRILQTLVAVELRLRNLKAVSSLLKSAMQADPLLLETWRLVIGLEILFGEKSDERSKKISEEMEQRQLVFACNTFGDGSMPDQEGISSIGNLQTESLSLRGLGLEYIPNAVLLKTELKSLNVSGNELTELPMGLRQLKNLRELNASENALIEFPACVNSLTQLEELRLAHNNMSTIPLPILPHLSVMDIRWNAATHLPASSLAGLTSLEVLQAEENAIPVDELSKISDLLSSREVISSPDAEAPNQQQAEGKQGEVVTEQPTQAKNSENIIVDQAEGTSAIATTETTNAADTELPSITTEDVDTAALAAKEADGDQIMEQVHVGTASKSKEEEGEQMMDTEVEVVDSASQKGALDQIMVQRNDDSPSTAKEDGRDQAMTQGNVDKTVTSATKVAEQPKEIIDLYSSESPEENEMEATTSVTAANTAIVLSIPATNEPSTDNIADAEDFTQNRSDAVTATATRRETCHELATLARRKLAAYMEENHIDSRAEVRKRNPTLWREFLGANINVRVDPELPPCRLCFAPNDGHNQRFNSTVLCVHCLEETLLVLKERNEQVEEALEIGRFLKTRSNVLRGASLSTSASSTEVVSLTGFAIVEYALACQQYKQYLLKAYR